MSVCIPCVCVCLFQHIKYSKSTQHSLLAPELLIISSEVTSCGHGAACLFSCSMCCTTSALWATYTSTSPLSPVRAKASGGKGCKAGKQWQQSMSHMPSKTVCLHIYSGHILSHPVLTLTANVLWATNVSNFRRSKFMSARLQWYQVKAQRSGSLG